MERRAAFAAIALSGALALDLCGCSSPGTVERVEPNGPLATLPAEPPPAAAGGQTYEYTQRPIAEMSEEARAEYIERSFRLPAGIADSERGPAPPGSPAGKSYEHGYRIPGIRPGLPLASRIEEDPRLWGEIGPGYSPYATQSADGTVVTERRYDPFPFANTLIFGTLGGIIGHQSDDTEEGVLIGAGYGLLLDLMRW